MSKISGASIDLVARALHNVSHQISDSKNSSFENLAPIVTVLFSPSYLFKLQRVAVTPTGTGGQSPPGQYSGLEAKHKFELFLGTMNLHFVHPAIPSPRRREKLVGPRSRGDGTQNVEKHI